MKNKIEKEVLKETENCGNCPYIDDDCCYNREERKKTRNCDKRLIKLTQQKTAQQIFDDYCNHCVYNELPDKETKQFNKKSFYCKRCWFKKLMKKKWGCK